MCILLFSLFDLSFVASPSVLWYCWLGLLTCKNHRLYNLYCVGADVKPCSINLKWLSDTTQTLDETKESWAKQHQKIHIQATTEWWQRRCRGDVPWQTVLDTSGGDWESSVSDGRQLSVQPVLVMNWSVDDVMTQLWPGWCVLSCGTTFRHEDNQLELVVFM